MLSFVVIWIILGLVSLLIWSRRNKDVPTLWKLINPFLAVLLGPIGLLVVLGKSVFVKRR